jgi:membrane protease YdiL (CAAX protease family)
LWVLSVISVGAGIPYAFDLQKEAIANVPIPFPAFVLVTVAQTALLLALAIYLGKILAKASKLRVFSLETGSSIKSILKFGVPMGVITAAAIYAADILFHSVLSSQISVGSVQPALWKTILASFYGGIVEEVLMRLFLMTLIVWVLTKLFRAERSTENKIIMWSAMIISAIIFGLGHLPVTAAITAITPVIVLRAIVLNGIGGLVFGWLYWKKGLEYGIVAHFTADIFLLTVLPTIFSRL